MIVNCISCSESFDNETFYDGRPRVQSKRRLWCSLDCKKNSKIHADYNMNYRLKRDYNITLSDFNKMVEERNGRCDICGRSELTKHGKTGTQFRLNIDHDHSCCDGFGSCGKCIRGLLCTACNRGLGFFRDNPELLSNALVYLGVFNELCK